MTIKMVNSEDRSHILDTQCKSWAELTRAHSADEGTLHTESNIPRKPPHTVQFFSKAQFGKRTNNDAQTENQTNASAANINLWLRNPNDDKNFENLVRRFNLKDVLIRRHGPESEIPTR
jgi:hypothetical protein